MSNMSISPISGGAIYKLSPNEFTGFTDKSLIEIMAVGFFSSQKSMLKPTDRLVIVTEVGTSNERVFNGKIDGTYTLKGNPGEPDAWVDIPTYSSKWENVNAQVGLIGGQIARMRGHFISKENSNTDPIGIFPPTYFPSFTFSKAVSFISATQQTCDLGVGGNVFGITPTASLNDKVYVDSVEYIADPTISIAKSLSLIDFESGDHYINRFKDHLLSEIEKYK